MSNKQLSSGGRLAEHLRVSGWLFLFFCFSMTACTSAKIQTQQPGYTLKPTNKTVLARHYRQQIKAHPGKSGFALLGSGLDAFAARTTLFQLAEKSIDVQYYIVRDDLTGHLFFQALKAAADRGVRVRVLLDDLSQYKQTATLAVLAKHPNIRIRLFNPLKRNTPRLLQFLFRFERFNRRMHNKSVIIDNQATILGSRNIGNEYAEIASGSIYSGMEVLAVGPLVKHVSAAFDQYWNYQRSVGVQHLAKPGKFDFQRTREKLNHNTLTKRFATILKTSPLIQQLKTGTLPLHWANAALIADPPDKIEKPARPNGEFLKNTDLKPYFNNTRQKLLFITPYLVPGQEGLQFFRQLRERGIEVSILTNSYTATDVRLVNSHYKNYRKPLLEMGVKLFEFKSVRASVSLLQRTRNIIALADRGGKAGLHAKIINFDQSHLYIGSMNIDPRSIYANTELGVMISSPDMSTQVLKWFDQNLDQLAYHLSLHNGQVIWRDFSKQGRGRTYHKEPDTNPLDRIFMHLMGLLPVEQHL
ncbi:MAG: phospholipase D family protein [Thiolinea sp.]